MHDKKDTKEEYMHDKEENKEEYMHGIFKVKRIKKFNSECQYEFNYKFNADAH